MDQKKTMYIAAGLSVAVLGGVILMLLFAGPKDTVGNVIGTPTGTLFTGKITNAKVSPGQLAGVGVYDRNCVTVEGRLTNCHGGIKTDKYGTLDFNYVHDMHAEPCIAPGQKVLVTILDTDGNAKVQRY